MAAQRRHYRIVIVGGGTGGITVAARLRRAGERDIAVIEPSDKHYYQPLWTLVGAGQATIAETERAESSVIPRGVDWIEDAVVAADPQAQTLTLASGAVVGYDRLVLSPGIAGDWDAIEGMGQALETGAVSSNYRADLAPKTWELIRGMRAGTAVFMAPEGVIKCGGAPQKIAYLAADHWRREGVLDQITVILALPGDGIFGVPDFAAQLHKIVEDYGIDLRLGHALTRIEGEEQVAVFRVDGQEVRIDYDMMHVIPPHRAPSWVAEAGLGDAAGFIEVDPATLQHVRYPNVFALGDATSTPPATNTGAAIRKQAPVLVKNLRAQMSGHELTARYDGYSACPITAARGKVLLAEFDYDLNITPTVPLIDTVKPRRDMWLLKRYGLPAMYWRLMLKGLA